MLFRSRAILGAPAERTFYAWRGGTAVRVPADTLRRIGYVAGIYKALQILLPQPAAADTWVKRPNDAAPFARFQFCDIRFEALAVKAKTVDHRRVFVKPE